MPPTNLLASRISQQPRLLNSYSSWERAPIRDFICGHIPVLSFGCHFGLDVHQFRPYSLRRGGATHIFQCSGSMGLAMLKGRWQSSQVARIYISNGLSYLPNSKMSPDTDKLLRQYHFFSYHQGWQRRSGGLRLESWNGMSWRRWKLFRAARWPVSTTRQDFKSPYHERGWINVSAFNQEGINQFQVSPKCWKRQGLNKGAERFFGQPDGLSLPWNKISNLSTMRGDGSMFQPSTKKVLTSFKFHQNFGRDKVSKSKSTFLRHEIKSCWSNTSRHPFFRWIFHYKPSSYWGTPIDGNPHRYICIY